MDINEFVEIIREPSNIIDLSDKAVLKYKNSDVFILNSFFKNKFYKLIENEIIDIQNNLDNNIFHQQDDNRIQIKFENTSYIREFQSILDEDDETNKRYLDFFEEKFGWNIENKTNKHLSFTIWIDQEGYNIPLHYDHDGIKYSIQIYLSEYRKGIGTSLSYSDLTKDTFVDLGFVQNGGYAMKNSHDFYHGMEQKVPKNYNRVSLYFIIG